MDYHSVHGHDVSSFDIAGTHRLPTVQASQALDELPDDGGLYLSTGLQGLDQALLPPSPSRPPSSASVGGIKRGQVTEVWGAPGTGKTALAIQLAANSIRGGNHVVWIDCFQETQVSRLQNVLEAATDAVPGGSIQVERPAASRGEFVHFSCLTMAHFMALVSRPNAKSIPEGTALMVASNLSALINSALPKATDGKTGSKNNKGPTASAKRLQGLQFIINALQKVAATRNCAVVVSSQCATRMQSESGATLVPAVNASVWEQGISTRIVMFRDWAWNNGTLLGIFKAGLQKLDGKSGSDAIERVAAFNVGRQSTMLANGQWMQTGIARVECDDSKAPAVEPADVVRPKRKLEQTDLEVPDSQGDENYGWADDDDAALPAPPPQWQGSEDVLLGQELGRNDDGRDEDEDEDACENSNTPPSS
ncbi:Circadian clock protein KaiC/DNA repair protein RadA [Metarhizium album ARSEF 1941]|uniref:Circadian clock protein KaiC/DNA repair protein RadA n=1 Tax=Metarhizium album (strain ARSEF 1941) TaxID=1081103 RepID=A0A0B2WWT3_METAS|nr:Circadian clock protein KaiC/DNA repair protein RadA [Metarhizium album ARSEF 1941]KHN98069.1 Circadian clock protein KaiC/DNA repair protein RadA [Metarhizium album ARSEF 1941]